MTSEERHQRRYERRRARRAAKRAAAIAQYDNFDKLCTCNALFKAARQSRKSIRWKGSVQRYFMSWLRNIIILRQKLLAGEDVTMGFIEFDIFERGKPRHIKSVHFKERVAQACLDGLQQLGANHTVPEAKDKLSKYINQQAHDQI